MAVHQSSTHASEGTVFSPGQEISLDMIKVGTHTNLSSSASNKCSIGGFYIS
jgi:hypothetical protein